MTEEPTHSLDVQLSRRVFLGSMVAVGGMVLVGCQVEGAAPVGTRAGAESGIAAFFAAEERRTVDAVVGRLIPGSPTDPGALEAGVTDYIDRKLAGFAAFAEPTFLSGPFVEVVEAGQAPASHAGLVVSADQLYRYGYQSGLLPQHLYRAGLQRLDAFASGQFGAPFADLTADQQDALLDALDRAQQGSEGGGEERTQGSSTENAEPEPQPADPLVMAARSTFAEVSPGEFFTTIRTDCVEGMFSDPSYGGNRNLVGWRLIGYPGYQRSYSPEEMLRGTRREPQPLSALPSMNPDRHSGHAERALEQPMPGVKDG